MAAPEEVLHFLAAHLRLQVKISLSTGHMHTQMLTDSSAQELQALSQTCAALRTAVRELPLAVWHTVRDRTVPPYHPLSSTQDVPAAAARLWSGYVRLLQSSQETDQNIDVPCGVDSASKKWEALLLQVRFSSSLHCRLHSHKAALALAVGAGLTSVSSNRLLLMDILLCSPTSHVG